MDTPEGIEQGSKWEHLLRIESGGCQDGISDKEMKRKISTDWEMEA